MIGIINEVMSAYSIAERVQKSFPKTTIYLYVEDNIDKGINLLKDNCSIIILPNIDQLSFYKKKYPNIYFLELDVQEESEELIRAIDTGNNHLVKEIIVKKNYSEDTIILNNPKLLFIKNIIEEVYSNKEIIDSIDNVIEKLKEKEYLLKDTGGEIMIIGEKVG